MGTPDCAALLEAARAVCDDGAALSLESAFEVARVADLAPSAMNELVHALRPDTGWLMVVDPQGSEIIDLPVQADRMDDRMMLEGEFMDEAGLSCRVARGEQGLDLHVFGRGASARLSEVGHVPSEVNSADYIVERVERLSTENRALGRVAYRVFWRAFEGFGMRQAFAAFDGFVEETSHGS